MSACWPHGIGISWWCRHQKNSWPGVENTPPQNGLNFFCQDRFNIVCPDPDFLVFKVRMKSISNHIGGNNISSGDIDLQRRINRFVPANNCHSKTTLFVIILDRCDVVQLQVTSSQSGMAHISERDEWITFSVRGYPLRVASMSMVVRLLTPTIEAISISPLRMIMSLQF